MVVQTPLAPDFGGVVSDEKKTIGPNTSPEGELKRSWIRK